MSKVEPVHAGLNAFCQTETNTHTLPEKFAKESTKRPTTPEFVESNNDNLNDFVSIEPQYLQLNNDLYDIKIEDKPLQARENIELSNIYEEADDSLSDHKEKEDAVEENQSMYNYGCQYCPIMFLTEEDILVHITEAHPEVSLKIEDPSSQAIQNLKKRTTKTQ
ncbi:hypothetical protein NQ314_006030 [Rhamnusium bicolor]|uniref:C2H2-type domain-containing protein n=1 Tax=Rhamnusium bicolor TaxID=1586634 RepID=A0AAV8ZBM4_9CUCU|nr:hypothetical protein NQ314_006030 [Rhamnusium bicolor]